MVKRIFHLVNWNLAVLIVMLAAGFGLRSLNLTAPPLDFHASRQLSSAIIARGMYYQMLPNADPGRRQIAISLWKGLEVLEPRILERIVALTYYLVGSEQLWIARIYSSLFWIIGGLALYGLAKRMTSVGGGLAALAFYLFVPLGVFASRSFQPDPFMVMWMLLALYSLYCWSEKRTWKWAVLTGLFAGLAALIKIYAAVILGPPLIMMTLTSIGLPKIYKNGQVWVMALICITIPAVYYLAGIGGSSSGFFSFWTTSFTNLWLKPTFYFSWLDMLDQVVGKDILFVGLAGLVFLQSRGRNLTLGLWIGYGIYGLIAAYHIVTHDYYSLAVIPIMSLSLAALFSLLIEKIVEQPRFWKGFLLAIAIFSIAVSAWLARNGIVSQNNASEVGGWTQMGNQMPKDGRIIALTHDYGYRIEYYGWIYVDTWPYLADFNVLTLRNDNGASGPPTASTFDQYFESMIAGHKYFLVTLFDELDAQPLLKDKLYSTYPISQKGDGYIIFDLDHPLLPAQQP
ncbi:MAG: ArnT family glycosyltransferase [Anaerolineales bacterium]